MPKKGAWCVKTRIMKETIVIAETELKKAASEGMDAFLKVFTDKYAATVGEEWTAESMGRLNGDQMTLLVYSLLHAEVCDGGFIQLIYNGYGPLVFDNPFAKAMRLYGLHDFSNLIYKAKRLYDAEKEELTRDRSDEEFMAMFEQHEKFNDIDDDFLMMEEEVTETLARYVDEHIERFAEIAK